MRCHSWGSAGIEDVKSLPPARNTGADRYHPGSEAWKAAAQFGRLIGLADSGPPGIASNSGYVWSRQPLLSWGRRAIASGFRTWL